MRRTSFREEGVPHTLVVIADLTRALREEEIKAWQRLVRVLGHELNNSLAPIKSISGSLRSLMKREDRAHDWEEDMTSGLEIIESRAEGLNQFMAVYANLAKLPPPNPAPTDMGRLIRRVAALQTNVPVEIVGGPEITANIDAAQIEQVLINLFKNAAEAVIEHAEETGNRGGVRTRWTQRGQSFEVVVEDDGAGIANPANLFVPFFTTKATGSGIGLVLCRQIIENHGGTIALENRADEGATGMLARLRLAI
jgi:nitrogen fixation/metabolism regulation signal transduction histidine kinase